MGWQYQNSLFDKLVVGDLLHSSASLMLGKQERSIFVPKGLMVIPWPLPAHPHILGKIGMLTGHWPSSREEQWSGRLGHCTWNNTFFLPGRERLLPDL